MPLLFETLVQAALVMNAFAALNYLEAFSLTVLTSSVNFESVKRSDLRCGAGGS